MRALSVQQPWPELIRAGRKVIELRTWSTAHRGDLLICAGQKADPRGVRHGIDGPRGVARAMVDLHGIRPAVIGDAEEAGLTAQQMRHELDLAAAKGATLYAWLFRDSQPVEPFSVKGSLGLFDVELPLA